MFNTYKTYKSRIHGRVDVLDCTGAPNEMASVYKCASQ